MAALKDNQEKLHALAHQKLDGTAPAFASSECSCGFANDRAVRVQPVEPDAAQFPHIAQVVSVERTSTHKKSQEVTIGCRYFGTSLRPEETTPRELGRKVRGYWGVENRVHWLRDVIGQEDKCRLRDATAACVLALLRTALLAVVKAAGFDSLKLAQEHFTTKLGNALRIIRYQRLATLA